MKALYKSILFASLLGCVAFLSGCAPFGMGFATPVPMQPWVADRIEDRLLNKNDHRTPILPAIPPGHRSYCEDPPDASGDFADDAESDAWDTVYLRRVPG